MSINQDSGEQKHENVVFRDSDAAWSYSVPSMPDSTFNVAGYSDAKLEDFFMRPVKIASYDWTIGADLKQRLDPWSLYFNDTRVVNRIANYNLLRAKLKVKFVLNGNGFHFSRALASYQFLPNMDDFTVTSSLGLIDWVELSQRPHVFLDPTNSQGATLELPFLWHRNWLSIPAAEWSEMGRIDLQGLFLKHANGAADAVTISVFAWAENVEISVPTSVEPGTLSPQCGVVPERPIGRVMDYFKRLVRPRKKTQVHFSERGSRDHVTCDICVEKMSPQAGDEYGTGIVSRPAAIVAGAAGKLRDIPVIGMYARATQMAASAVSGIAKLFGYSRPVVITDTCLTRNVVGGNLANTDAADAIDKLTLDSKQELTIDSRVVGLAGADELAINSVVTRESYITSFEWRTSTAAETAIFSTRVEPILWSKEGAANHLPAMCFGALPFRYWHGTITFRFMILASAYHKGRLRITYDPQETVSTEYNVAYTRIIDLAKDRDVSIDVGWGQQNTYQEVNNLEGNPPYVSNNGVMTVDGTHSNGTLSVGVLNELTTPNSTVNNDIQILVFARMKPDAKFAAPTSANIQDISWFTSVPPVNIGRITPQSGDDDPDGTNMPEENRPIDDSAEMEIGAPSSAVDHTNDVFFGEEVTSFRQCLKRYNYHGSRSPNAGLKTGTWLKYNMNFPFYRAFAPGAVHTDVTLTDFNYCKMTLLNYLTPAYVARRGGLRQKYHLETRGSRNLRTLLRCSRLMKYSGGDSNVILDAFSDAAVNPDSQNAYNGSNWYSSDWPGGAVTTSLQSDFLEVELPFYTNRRFLSAKQANHTLSVETNPDHMHVVNVCITDKEDLGSDLINDRAILHRWVSVGEDFNLAMFTHAPIAYLVDDPLPESGP